MKGEFFRSLFSNAKKENQSFSCIRTKKKQKKTEPPAEANDPVS